MSIPVEIISKSQDLSDWIVVGAAVTQALGSVAAIIAAALITNHDRVETRREERSQQVSALASILFKAESTIREPYERMTENPPARFGDVFFGPAWEARLREGERCLRIMQAVPHHELEWELASAVMEMEEALTVGMKELATIREENRAALIYPDMARIDVGALREPVNLAARAAARIHQAAHQNSPDPKARRYRIQPATV